MSVTEKYDMASPDWERKIRHLGYSQAYFAFLRSHAITSGPVLDVGAGTGAFARAWVAAKGSQDLTLLEPSSAMLQAAQTSLAECDVKPAIANTTIEEYDPPRQFETVLAAHVVEHFPDPAVALRLVAQWLVPGGKMILVVSRPHWCN